MIKCSKCGAELSDDTRFCSYCGSKIDSSTPPPPPIIEEPVISGSNQSERFSGVVENPHVPKSLADKAKDKGIQIWNKLSLYGKITTVSVAAFVMLFLVALMAGKIAAVIISVVQIVLAVCSILMHKGIIKLEQKLLWAKWLALAISILLVALNIMSYSWGTTSDAGDDRTTPPSISTGLEDSDEQQGETFEPSEILRTEKNGFDSTSNEVYNLAGYTVEIPSYWKSENLIDGGFQRYSETGGKVAMLQVTASEEGDDNYPVTFDGLMDDNDNMIKAIEATAFSEVTSYEIVDTGVIKGILYKGTMEDQNSGLTGYGEWFTFPSEIDRNWCTLILSQTENTEYSYVDDFAKIIQSIKPAEEIVDVTEDYPETPMEPVVEDPEPVENLTVENCPDLASLLALRDPGDPSVSEFASKYYGQIIEFDGCVMNMQNNGNYTTRWNVLLGAGDYDENSALGPNFRLTDVNFYDMNVTGGDSLYAGLNVRVVAEVGNYNSNSQLFELDIVGIHIRD